MPDDIAKVTTFITRPPGAGTELLLFEHPYAGIQIPAGTVEAGETPAQAAQREAAEETGLASLSIRRYLGSQETRLPQGQKAIAHPTRVYARPDLGSFDWAYLRRGIRVTAERQAPGFVQIAYKEPDRLPNPSYVTLCILGWVPESVLVGTEVRHYYHLQCQGPTPDTWTVDSDNHKFKLFWAPLSDLPAILPPQDGWLEHLPHAQGEQKRGTWRDDTPEGPSGAPI